MSLSARIVLVLCAVILLYMGVELCIQRGVLVPGLSELQEQEAGKDLDRCLAALHREIEVVDTFCIDWGAWDDTYDYVLTRNPAYESANLDVKWFHEIKLNLIYILNSAGEVVWGNVYDLETEQVLDMPEFPKTSWPTTHPLLQHKEPKSSIAGIVQTGRGPMILASRPVVTSAVEGPIRGTLIMGRFLTQTVLDNVSKQTRVAFHLWEQGEREGFPGHPFLPADMSAGPVFYSHGDDDALLHAATMFPDVYGEPAFIVQSDTGQDILRRGMEIISVVRLSSVGAGLMMLIVVLVLIRWAALNPIRKLTRHVASISGEGTLRLLSMPPRADEVGILAREFDNMVLRIQRDNSERARAENALRESELRTRAIVETAPDGILTLTQDGIIESLNPAAGRMFKYEPSDAVGRPIVQLIPGDIRDEEGQDGAESPDGAYKGHETTGVRSDGESFPLYWTVSAGQVGERRIRVCVVRDMSEWKRMQNELLRAQHMAAIGEMGASIAHEIRNPLAGISAAVQVIRAGLSESDPRRMHMDEAIRNVTRVEAIIRQLLSFAKTWSPKKEPVCLRRLAEDTVKQGRLREVWKGVEFRFGGAEECRCLVDPALFEQVLVNIFDNAADALEPSPGKGGQGEKGVVCIFGKESGYAVMRVRDSGCGMADDVREKALRPLFTTKIYGTGLGLPICRRIVEAHGGTLAISSVSGEGTEIEVRLPLKG